MKLKIDGKEFEFVVNAQTPIIFQRIFKEDLMKVAYDLNTASKLAFVMNAQTEGGRKASMKSQDDWFDWLEDFRPNTWIEPFTDEIIGHEEAKDKEGNTILDDDGNPVIIDIYDEGAGIKIVKYYNEGREPSIEAKNQVAQ